MTTAVAEKPNLYEEIIDNIKSENVKWCSGAYVTNNADPTNNLADSDDFTEQISACLVGHVDLATGVSKATVKKGRYGVLRVKEWFSKDARKWRRRNQAVIHLAQLIDPKSYYTTDDLEIQAQCEARSRSSAGAEGVVTGANDDDLSKPQVLALLRKAAKKFPND